MKRNLFFILSFILVLSSCTKDTVTQHYTFYRAQYTTKESVRASMRSLDPQQIENAGKIYVRGNYVFLNDIDKGIHIIDYSDAANPKNIAFIKIPGSVDMAVRGDYLYADCYTDLVAFDISNPRQVRLTNFIPGVFPQRTYSWMSGYTRDTSLIVEKWIKVDTIVTNEFSYGGDKFFDAIPLSNCISCSFTTAANAPSQVNGIGGSMARFTLLSDRLYTVDNDNLKIFNVSNAPNPSYVGTKNIGWGIETVYPFKNKLFIGSTTGMFIFDVTNKDNPIQAGSFAHARVCDPVIADDNVAYVTLSSGNQCAGFTNQLDVLNVTNIMTPTLLRTYPMSNPKGLSKDGNTLIICDGTSGVRFFNASNSMNITQVSALPLIQASYDVIALGGLAIVTAPDGLYFIDYTNVNMPVVKSKINLN